MVYGGEVMFRFEEDFYKVLTLLTLCVTVVIIGAYVYFYKVNAKFIENGYELRTVPGYNGLVWQKVREVR